GPWGGGGRLAGAASADLSRRGRRGLAFFYARKVLVARTHRLRRLDRRPAGVPAGCAPPPGGGGQAPGAVPGWQAPARGRPALKRHSRRPHVGLEPLAWAW